MRKARLEIEIKLRTPSAAKMRRLLRRLGARPIGRVHEMNVLFDAAGSALGRAGRLLRVRRLRRLSGGGRGRGGGGESSGQPAAMLTYKGPGAGGRYKVREEIEAGFDSSARLEHLLAALGFQPWFRYEKYRTSFRLPRLPNLSVELDETPIGPYVELEGSRRAIDQAARRLGYGPADYITASYYELFRLHQAAGGPKPSEMVFSAKKRRIPRVFP
ncbi:MAG TPA: class IV adenylate cyclase [Candidatus Acidoferrales bacterium]|nr:class IV adenylate cyclase [Candidatus Acidoferrales bacterium]